MKNYFLAFLMMFVLKSSSAGPAGAGTGAGGVAARMLLAEFDATPLELTLKQEKALAKVFLLICRFYGQAQSISATAPSCNSSSYEPVNVPPGWSLVPQVGEPKCDHAIGRRTLLRIDDLYYVNKLETPWGIVSFFEEYDPKPADYDEACATGMLRDLCKHRTRFQHTVDKAIVSHIRNESNKHFKLSGDLETYGKISSIDGIKIDKKTQDHLPRFTKKQAQADWSRRMIAHNQEKHHSILEVEKPSKCCLS